MKTKLTLLITVLAGAGLALGAGDANSSKSLAQGEPLSLQTSMITPNSVLTNDWFSPNFYTPYKPITGKYWIANGKELGVRSAYLVQQDLNRASTCYLANHPNQAVGEILKAALLLQEDRQMAKASTRDELNGSALVLEHTAERIADGNPEPMSQMNATFSEARRAASDFDLARFGGL